MNMENSPKISIIVPVYEVEQYMNRCINSIVNQTYENLEIILVDDGSPDSCPEICEEWAKLDNRIKVIHKKNGGLSDARNKGMNIATGELIGFVDSDDWISPDMYTILYEQMVKNDSDISACGVEKVWENKKEKERLTPLGSYVLNREEAMEAIIDESLLKQPVWYKLYKRKVIQNVSFPVGKYHEDVFWTYQIIGNANKVSIIDTPCYFYYQRKGSIMDDAYSLKRLDSIEAKVNRVNYIKNELPLLYELSKRNLWFSCIYSMQMSLQYLDSENFSIAKSKIKNIITNNNYKPKTKGISFKEKIWIILSRISFTNTCRLRNVLKVGI